MAIPVGIILIWDGANSAIPTGWTRETLLDGKFPKAWGASVAPNVAGGSNTHSHSAGHGHTLNAHTHAVYSSAGWEKQSDDSGGSGSVAWDHSHISIELGGITGGDLQSTTVTWTTVDNQPPYKEVIFIKPNAAPAPLHNGICAHYNDVVAPIGFALCDGNNGTFDFRNKYLKGAAAAADAGATGGATAHPHTVTHGHTANAHNHAGWSGLYNDWQRGGGSADPPRARYDHRHWITLANATDTVANFTKTDAGAGDTVEPAFKKIHLIKNIQGGVNEKAGLIGLWLGDTAALPANWVLCDGNNGTNDLRDKYIKIALDSSELNGIGGSNTHTHTAVSHSHTSAGAHGHTITADPNASTSGGNGGQGSDNSRTSHPHNWYQNNATASYANTDLTSGAAVSNEPVYLTVAYVQLLRADAGGASILSCL